MDAAGLRRTPSARTIARLTTIGRDTLSKAETPTIVAIENNVPALVDARAAVEESQTTIRKKAGGMLDGWIDLAKAGLLASFANRVVRDRAAVAAAITNRWPNGRTESQITRLKLIKRQMRGRAKSDLLEERLIGADPTTKCDKIASKPKLHAWTYTGNNRALERRSDRRGAPCSRLINPARQRTWR